MNLSPKAFDLIVENEGLGQPGQWPGNLSGITIGFGYDLGFKTVAQFGRDWGDKLDPIVMSRLSHAVGKRGDEARLIASTFRDITIRREDAAAVLRANSIPWAIAETQRIFPGVERLPDDAAGALVSLVFNRGGSLSGERRKEMRAIQMAVITGNLAEIASQLRSMKRLWVGKAVDGLLRRREDEARMIETCLDEMDKGDAR